MVDSTGNCKLKLSYLGEAAILCESVGTLDAGAPDLGLQTQFWALAEVVSQWPAVDEVVPGMNNLMVVLRPGISEPWALLEDIRKEWPHVAPATLIGRVIDVPVTYGGQHGPDLQFVASRAGLTLEDAAALHCQPDYTVYFLGAHAGFGYLGGLDARLHTPRLDKPRMSVPAGSVAIGGVQTGVIALTSPSGWRLIGRAEESFFDPLKEPPALLSPGDTVKFRINRVEA